MTLSPSPRNYLPQELRQLQLVPIYAVDKRTHHHCLPVLYSNATELIVVC